jgi:hypothetical protein
MCFSTNAFSNYTYTNLTHTANVGGGKWTLRLRKGLSSRLFEGKKF